VVHRRAAQARLRRPHDRPERRQGAVGPIVVGTQVDPGDHLTCVVADLTSDEGWPEAVTGCDYVLHIASPLGMDSPSNPTT